MCKDKCTQYKAERPANGKRYASGQVRCQICEIYMTKQGCKDGKGNHVTKDTKELRCKCCNYHIRTKPRNRRYKENLKYSQDIDSKDNQAEGAVDNQAEGAVDNQAEGAVDNQAEGAVDNQAEGAVDNQAEGAVDNQAEGAVDNQGAGSIVNQANFFTSKTMSTNSLSKKLKKLISEFVKNKKCFEIRRESQKERDWSRDEFEDDFPIDGILNMDLDDYVVGKPKPSKDTNRDTFCYRLEHENLEFGILSGASSNMFGIYFDKDYNKYKYKNENLISTEDAFEEIKHSIKNMLDAGKQFQKDGDVEKLTDVFEASKQIHSHVRLKILSVYFPDTFLGINTRPQLKEIFEELGHYRKNLKDRMIEGQMSLLELKRSHPIMNYWSNQDYTHFLKKTLIQKDTRKSQTNRNYLLIKHNSNERKMDNKLKKSYRFGKVINYNKVNANSKIIEYDVKNQEIYFLGFGNIESVQHEPNNFIVARSHFKLFNQPDPTEFISYSSIIPKKVNKTLQQKIKNSPSWDNQNSIVEINKELFEEIIDSDAQYEIFKDTHLKKPTQSEMESGLEKISEKFIVNPDTIREIVINLASGRHVILAGPVGTGKTELARRISKAFWTDNGGYYAEEYTATADWSTTDVIGGIMPKMIDGHPSYEIQLGSVSETIRRNWKKDDYNNRITDIRNNEPCRGTWLVIDEFNRADIDKAFGQLFTSLESRKLKIPSTNSLGYTEMSIPKDYRIIATLNTADKHYLFHLSDALKRRFAYIEINSPDRKEKYHEIYYAVKNAMQELSEDDYSSLVKLDNNSDKRIIDKNESDPKFVRILEKAYDVLDFIRLVKPLGTAVLKSIYQTMLVGATMDNNYDRILDMSLRTNLIHQLENVSPTNIETIISVFYENPIDNFKKIHTDNSNKEKYKDDLDNVLEFMKLNENNKKQMIEQFLKSKLDGDKWDKQQKEFETNQQPLKEELFKKSLQGLLKSSTLI